MIWSRVYSEKDSLLIIKIILKNLYLIKILIKWKPSLLRESRVSKQDKWELFLIFSPGQVRNRWDTTKLYLAPNV